MRSRITEVVNDEWKLGGNPNVQLRNQNIRLFQAIDFLFVPNYTNESIFANSFVKYTWSFRFCVSFHRNVCKLYERVYKTSAFQTRIENIPLVRPSCAVEPLCADAGGGRFHALLHHWTVGRPPRSRHRLLSSSKARIPQSPCRP